MKQRTRQSAGGSFASFLLTLAAALVVRSTVVQAFTIPSGSATPTLLTGDTIVVSKFAYGYDRFSLPLAPAFLHGRIALGAPHRGDMVVFANPHGGEVTIKRIVGLPGDRIQVTAGVLRINGVPCPRTRIGTYVERDWDADDAQLVAVERYEYRETLPGGVTHRILGMPIADAEDSGPADDTAVYTVPPGHYFGMGDSRDNSLDSRFLDALGYIPAENLIGRAELRLISLQPGDQLWQIWKWPGSLRLSRFLGPIS